ncbi:MAG: hypothetical protein WCR19_00015 [Acholeplasmataceae bacterium]
MINYNQTDEIDLITNKIDKSFYHELKTSLKECSSFYISVAFINSLALGLFKDEFNSFN